jgi:hypothetical protein
VQAVQPVLALQFDVFGSRRGWGSRGGLGDGLSSSKMLPITVLADTVVCGRPARPELDVAWIWHRSTIWTSTKAGVLS